MFDQGDILPNYAKKNPDIEYETLLIKNMSEIKFYNQFTKFL